LHVLSLYSTKEGKIEIEKPIQATRVGLRQREDDKENYLDQPYRFIVELVRNISLKRRK